MIIPTIILRTQTFDYFRPKPKSSRPISKSHKKSQQHIEGAFHPSPIAKYKTISKNRPVKVQHPSFHNPRPYPSSMNENQAKIVKDESTRSLFTNELMREFKFRIEQKRQIFQEGFTRFEYPEIEVQVKVESVQ